MEAICSFALLGWKSELIWYWFIVCLQLTDNQVHSANVFIITMGKRQSVVNQLCLQTVDRLFHHRQGLLSLMEAQKLLPTNAWFVASNKKNSIGYIFDMINCV